MPSRLSIGREREQLQTLAVQCKLDGQGLVEAFNLLVTVIVSRLVRPPRPRSRRWHRAGVELSNDFFPYLGM
jgi:hypothetical protein